MSVRCFQCGTTLIAREEDRTPETKNLVRDIDSRIHTGVGTMLGFVLGWFVFQSTTVALVFGAIGAHVMGDDGEIYGLNPLDPAESREI